MSIDDNASLKEQIKAGVMLHVQCKFPNAHTTEKPKYAVVVSMCGITDI